MAQIIYKVFILIKLLEYNLSLGTELCEIGCEESELDSYLNECRNACNLEPTKPPANKLQEYLNCMYKSCLEEGIGPNAQIVHDYSWIECSQQCNRGEMLSAHASTQKPVFHTQYLSDKQYENFKIIQKIEEKTKEHRKQKIRKTKRTRRKHVARIKYTEISH